jgi:hypothetical protein
LWEQIKEAPDNYVRFPIDLHKYLSENWVRVPFEYKEEDLPEENEDITVQFQKWRKIK